LLANNPWLTSSVTRGLYRSPHPSISDVEDLLAELGLDVCYWHVVARPAPADAVDDMTP
jgi:hypothetical protein